MHVAFADISGIPTRYDHEGSGYPVPFIHGIGLSADSWLRNIDERAADFRVIAPDTLGHGFTGSGDHSTGPPQPDVVEHLAAPIDHLGLDRFAVAGSSMGAMLALLLYFRLPGRIERLILISSGSSRLSEEELSRTLSESFANGLSAIAHPTLESCRKRMENIFYDPAAVPDEFVLVQLTTYALPSAVAAYEARMRGMLDLEGNRPYRVADRLGEIEVPTLLVWGSGDPRVIFAHAEEAAAKMPDSRLVGFEKCKHHPHIEHAARFNARTRSFLEGGAADTAAAG